MCAAPKGMVFKRFWSEKGIDFDHFGVKYGMLGMFFTLAWRWVFCFQGTFSPHQHWHICNPSQMFTQMETIFG